MLGYIETREEARKMTENVMKFTAQEESQIRKSLVNLVNRLCEYGTSSEVSNLPYILAVMFPGSGYKVSNSTRHSIDETPPITGEMKKE